jgi:sulfate transport system permease protein
MCDVLSPMPLILPHEPDIKPETGWRFDVVPAALIGVSLVFLGLFLALPLLVILTEAFAKGLLAYFEALANDDVVSAVLLSLGVTFIVLPVNILGGLAFAWLLSRYRFFGKNILITLLDLPFSVSPVIAGLSYVLLYGAQGFFADFLKAQGLSIIFAVPGMVLVTVFVTFPFVAREVLPLMQALGQADEEAALSLGASGFQTVFLITLPNIRWALLYGVLLTNARAMGEFGAVAVVSGKIRGLTTTMPLMVDILYNEYQSVAAFALASVLALLALATLVGKNILEWKHDRNGLKAHPLHGSL